MDQTLDEILATTGRPQRNQNRRNDNHSNGGRNRGRDNSRNNYPRDGVRKSHTPRRNRYDDHHGGSDSEGGQWIHDRYEDHGRQATRGAPAPRRVPYRIEPEGYKIKIENIHYDITEAQLRSVIRNIGPILRFQMVYDRAGRSEGVAYITYATIEEAQRAFDEFDGALTKGRKIRVSVLGRTEGVAPARELIADHGRNPFDHAIRPAVPLEQRITAPGDGGKTMEDAARRGIDRYIPHEGDADESGREQGHRDRRDAGRRPGQRRDQRNGQRGGGPYNQHNNHSNSRPQNGQRGRGPHSNQGNHRPRKTADELDAEMDDYFAKEAEESQPAADEDMDMIE